MDIQGKLEEIVDVYLTDNKEKAQKAFEDVLALDAQGVEEACLYAGLFYYEGFGTEPDYDKAVLYLQRAVDLGYIAAMRDLGLCYYDGVGVEEDCVKAYSLLRTAASNGDGAALDFIKDFYFDSTDKEEYESKFVNMEITDEELEENLGYAAADSAEAQYLLGKYYLARGDFENAVKWAARAQENMFGLAVQLRESIADAFSEVEISDEQLEGILKSAKEKDALAQCMAGRYYLLHGDYEKALNYAEDAKVQKYPIADALLEHISGVFIIENQYRFKELLKNAQDNEGNAVEVGFGTPCARVIKIEDFKKLENLYSALGCEGINIVKTTGTSVLSLLCGAEIVGYVDRNGKIKELVNNAVISDISGYDYIAGACVLCGFDSDYAPLDGKTAAALCEWLNMFKENHVWSRIFKWIRRIF